MLGEVPGGHSSAKCLVREVRGRGLPVALLSGFATSLAPSSFWSIARVRGLVRHAWELARVTICSILQMSKWRRRVPSGLGLRLVQTNPRLQLHSHSFSLASPDPCVLCPEPRRRPSHHHWVTGRGKTLSLLTRRRRRVKAPALASVVCRSLTFLSVCHVPGPVLSGAKVLALRIDL